MFTKFYTPAHAAEVLSQNVDEMARITADGRPSVGALWLLVVEAEGALEVAGPAMAQEVRGAVALTVSRYREMVDNLAAK